MTTQSDTILPPVNRALPVARVLGLVLVTIGLFNTIPSIPGRAIDHDQSASMEKKKQEGYF